MFRALAPPECTSFKNDRHAGAFGCQSPRWSIRVSIATLEHSGIDRHAGASKPQKNLCPVYQSERLVEKTTTKATKTSRFYSLSPAAVYRPSMHRYQLQKRRWRRRRDPIPKIFSQTVRRRENLKLTAGGERAAILQYFKNR